MLDNFPCSMIESYFWAWRYHIHMLFIVMVIYYGMDLNIHWNQCSLRDFGLRTWGNSMLICSLMQVTEMSLSSFSNFWTCCKYDYFHGSGRRDFFSRISRYSQLLKPMLHIYMGTGPYSRFSSYLFQCHFMYRHLLYGVTRGCTRPQLLSDIIK